MKKLMVIAVVVALAVPCLAWSASNYVTSFKPGAYDGTISSVVPAINGKKVTMTLKYEGNNVVATVDFEGSKEVWTWNDKTLTQKEVDPKTGPLQWNMERPHRPEQVAQLKSFQ